MSNQQDQDATNKPIQFFASFPAIQSAIVISGNGDGVRIKLDIPETDLLPFLHALALRQTSFLVTIEPQDYEQNQATTSSKIQY